VSNIIKPHEITIFLYRDELLGEAWYVGSGNGTRDEESIRSLVEFSYLQAGIEYEDIPIYKEDKS